MNLTVMLCKECGREYQGYRTSKYCIPCRDVVKERRIEAKAKNPRTKICPVCNKEFTGHALALTCRPCRPVVIARQKEAKNKNPRTKDCSVCGKTFTGHALARSCQECRSKPRAANPRTKDCGTCGKTFTGHPLAKTCMDCRAKAGPKNPKTKPCGICHVEFTGHRLAKYCDTCRPIATKAANQRSAEKITRARKYTEAVVRSRSQNARSSRPARPARRFRTSTEYVQAPGVRGHVRIWDPIMREAFTSVIWWDWPATDQFSTALDNTYSDADIKMISHARPRNYILDDLEKAGFVLVKSVNIKSGIWGPVVKTYLRYGPYHQMPRMVREKAARILKGHDCYFGFNSVKGSHLFIYTDDPVDHAAEGVEYLESVGRRAYYSMQELFQDMDDGVRHCPISRAMAMRMEVVA